MKRIPLALTISFCLVLGCDSNGGDSNDVEIQIQDMNGMWQLQGEQDFLEIDEPNFSFYEWSSGCYEVETGTFTKVSGNKLEVHFNGSGEAAFEIEVTFEDDMMVIHIPSEEATDKYMGSDQLGNDLAPVCPA